MARGAVVMGCLTGMFALAWCAAAPLTDSFVVARAERREVAVGSPVVVRVEVVGECAVDAALLEPQAVDGVLFAVDHNPQTSLRRQSAASGEVTLYVAEYRVTVTPQRAGTYAIGPFRVTCPDGGELVSDVVMLRAVGGVAERAAIALAVVADRPWVYEREPFVVQLRLEVDATFYPTVTHSFVLPWWREVLSLDRDQPLLPDQRAFELADANRRVHLTTVAPIERDGERYVALTGGLRVLAPAPGSIAFAGSLFRCELSTTASSPGGQLVEALAPPAAIEVRALPTAGRPAAFVDAVGAFRIAARLDRADIGVGDPLVLTLRIDELRDGATNLPYARLVDLSAVAGFRMHGEPLVERTPTSAVFTVELSPIDRTTREVPAIELAWFDPDEQRYDHAFTAPLAVRVRDGGADSADAAPRAASRWSKVRALMIGGVALALAIAAFHARRRHARQRLSSASRDALAALLAGLAAHEVSGAVDALTMARLLARYLGDRLDMEAGRAFGEGAIEPLRAAGATEASIAEVSAIFATAEESAFARGAATLAITPKSVRALAERLERELAASA